MNDRETRTFDIKGLEVRDTASDDFVGQIGGYAVVFDEPSQNLGGFIERVDPNAFDDVDFSDVVALYDHNFANVLGRTSANTLKLDIDKKGLHFILDIPNTTLGNDVYTNIRAGNLKGMSFGFTVDSDEWGKETDDTPKRTINSVGALYEVSVVTMPAYQETTVAVTRALKNDAYKQKMLAVLKLYE
ncbi:MULTISPECIES: HK97 family phage prohead protease [Leuconostoc]|uniref:HK97 family phage prohead protease n=1 Tax=Leuconostoc TaxID=1243 RepID=UPI000A04689A|nr:MULTISPECIES: HK97 family phage prohead protease [Leuconostoc]MDG9745306.1 HK97 family phage prohead protease [Leuconostoc falkenbergense]QQB01346.1 HK97 family phage prohead protease [Leuconostoc pseudomesenteroides]